MQSPARFLLMDQGRSLSLRPVPPTHSVQLLCRASLTMSWPPSTGIWAAPLLRQQVLLLLLLMLLLLPLLSLLLLLLVLARVGGAAAAPSPAAAADAAAAAAAYPMGCPSGKA